jgi:hypothetical protein
VVSKVRHRESGIHRGADAYEVPFMRGESLGESMNAWENDPMFQAWCGQFINGKIGWREAMIQAWIAGATYKNRLEPAAPSDAKAGERPCRCGRPDYPGIIHRTDAGCIADPTWKR